MSGLFRFLPGADQLICQLEPSAPLLFVFSVEQSRHTNARFSTIRSLVVLQDQECIQNEAGGSRIGPTPRVELGMSADSYPVTSHLNFSRSANTFSGQKRIGFPIL